MSDRLPKPKRPRKLARKLPPFYRQGWFDYYDCPWIADDEATLKLVPYKEDCGEAAKSTGPSVEEPQVDAKFPSSP